MSTVCVLLVRPRKYLAMCFSDSRALPTLDCDVKSNVRRLFGYFSDCILITGLSLTGLSAYSSP